MNDHTKMAEGLTALGSNTTAPANPEEGAAQLERIPWSGTLTHVRFTCPEFTSLCPKTGQPDFATFVIDYEPNEWLVESKTLKLYMGSFRNHAGFHEACAASVRAALTNLLLPRWIRIAAFFAPRGGIPIDVLCAKGLPSLPPFELNAREYRAR
jgi:7-cyano-7-deazaguanine reductase